MARITYDSSKIGGALVAQAVDHIRKAQECLERAVAMANSIAAGGTTPALLEASPEFGVAAGQGSTFYTAVNNMKVSALTVTAASIGDLDMGDL